MGAATGHDHTLHLTVFVTALTPGHYRAAMVLGYAAGKLNACFESLSFIIGLGIRCQCSIQSLVKIPEDIISCKCMSKY